MTLNESIVEDAALNWLGELGYELHLTPGEQRVKDGMTINAIKGMAYG